MAVIDTLKTMRNNLGALYESEVKDDLTDNGNLIAINNAIINIETIIAIIQNRG
jgi:hypothetical protein